MEKNKGFTRIIKAAGYSLQGFRAAWQNEAAFRQELALCAVAAPLALFLGDTGTERALLLGSLFIILIVEIINSAIEALVDRISPDLHPLSGRAKDLGSAAVFLALLNAGVVWLAVLLG